MSEPYLGFDDAVSIWMALITERERLEQIVETKRNQSRVLTDEDVAGVEERLVRLRQLIELSHERREQLAALFVGIPKTPDQHAQEILLSWKEKTS